MSICLREAILLLLCNVWSRPVYHFVCNLLLRSLFSGDGGACGGDDTPFALSINNLPFFSFLTLLPFLFSIRSQAVRDII